MVLLHYTEHLPNIKEHWLGKTFDLSVKNPNKNNEVILRKPKEILGEMRKLDKESEKVLEKLLQKLLGFFKKNRK